MLKEYYTRKELVELCNCPHYIIDYLRELRRLPLIRKGYGGVPYLFAPECIEIIKAYLDR